VKRRVKSVSRVKLLSKDKNDLEHRVRLRITRSFHRDECHDSMRVLSDSSFSG
jgi:hypothetical protein